MRSLLTAALLPLALAACALDDDGVAPPNAPGRPESSEPPWEEPAPLPPETTLTDPAVITPRCTVDVPAEPGVVVTTNGAVRGAQEGPMWSWKGIRYAAPPTGARRFAAPALPACWTDVVDTVDYGAQCPQIGASTDLVDGDEDCLSLNVWTPAHDDGELLPVLFFIHGGAEILGASSQQTTPGFHIYDGAALAQTGNAIVITVNYRLGALGFLAHPSLRDDAGRAGNYGVQDLLLALRWVQDNGPRFGGDPDRVMIFGESAGGLNTCVLLASPKAAGLFSSAIMESGGCDAPTQARREQDGEVMAERFGCSDAVDVAACLREVDPGTLVRAPSVQPDLLHTWWLPYGPVVDGDVLIDTPIATIEAGQHNHVPFAVGSNEEEMNLFLPVGTVNTCLDYVAAAYALMPDQAAEVLDLYPCLSHLLPHDTFVAAATDVVFTSQARRAARAVAAHQDEPVFRYFFKERADWGPLFAMGSFHAFELLYVFDTLDEQPGYIATEGEAALCDAVGGYWSRFAGAGDPNGDGAVVWPQYDVATDPFLALDEEITTGAGLRTAECDYWDAEWSDQQ